MADYLKKFRRFEYQIDKYDNETHYKEILLKYRSKKPKRKKSIDDIKKSGLLERNRFIRGFLPKRLIEKHGNIDELPKSYYAQQIRQAIQTVPMPGLLPRMHKRIRRQALNRFGEKYAPITNDYLKNVKAHYIETIRQFHLKQFAVLTGEKNETNSNEKFKFKHPGRTAHHNKFLRHRKMIKEKLFIPCPFIRFILHSSNQHFPQVLNEYDGYKLVKSGIPVWFQLDDFEAMAQRDLENKSIFLREEWYPKVVHVLTKHYRKRIFSTAKWLKMLNCAKGLINRQITELKINTFEHIFDVISKRRSMPPIMFQAVCTNGRIELNPSVNEIVATYKRIFKNIATIATKLIPLEPLIDRLAFITADNYLKIEIGEITLNEMMHRLEDRLKIAYSPILEYVEIFENEYNDLLSEQTREDLDIFLSKPKKTDEYFEKNQYFRDFIEKIQKSVQTQIFDNAIVNQTQALVGLRTIAQNYVDEITEKIATGHRNDCQKICDLFANVKKRASEAPKSTETLLENGEFMLQMKNKKMAEISQHIQNTLIMSGRLLDLTQLSVDHFNLQISTIHWLNNIQEIFEQNSSQFEIYKNQFEEHLGEVTKKLTQDIDDFLPKLVIIDYMCDTTKLRDYYATLEDYLQQIKCFEDYINWINKEEKLFKLPVSQYPIVELLKDYVKPFADLIKLCIEWLRYYYIWMDGPFEYLNAATIENLVQNYKKDFEARHKYYRNRIKADMLGDPVLKFRGQTEDPVPENHPVPLRLCQSMINWLNEFQIGVLIVKIMCNPSLRDRHWAEMSSIAGFDLTPNAGTSLRKITKFGIDHLLSNFEIISIGANKELKLQIDLADMIEQWEHVDFPIEDFKDTGIKILGNIEDIQVLLDDHIIKTLSMRDSTFVKPFEQNVFKWYERLLRTSRIFDEWIQVQNGWLYYLPILSLKDISEELPIEDKLFREVNDIYCKYTKMAIDESNIMRLMETKKFLEDLTAANEMLEQIQDGVYAYLERKRLFFSRFFFLSNTELLQILCETKNPDNIQPFLCKCFNGIWRVQMNNNEKIDAMLSRMNEEIKFRNSVSMIGSGANTEKWLLGVEKEMHLSIKHEMINSYADYLTSDRIDWALSWAQMIVVVISNIFWTSDIHASLLNQNRELMVNIRNEIEKNLMKLTAIIRSNEMTNLNRITLKTLCIFDCHARDVTQKLIDDPNSNIECFQWMSQLRYYWNNNELAIRTLNFTIPYGYEYLGNFQRIVITPLSERCMLSVLLAFQNQMNASIEGPTATGKSETIKELAKFLAIQFKVFYCTPDVSFSTISQFLKGIAISGAWLCLEDFNCIGMQTLSVIAKKLRVLQMAKRSKVSRFVFDGFKISMNQNCNVCTVSVPSFRLSKLPDNLKSLFRPIVMVSPNVEQIVEVLLLANGFKNVKSTAKRIIKFYKICSEFLPQQKHCDFGMRNIVIALQVCANRLITETFQDSGEELIYQSLLNVNLPMINDAYLPIFQGIINDIFPKANRKPKETGWIQEIFNKMCFDKQFQPINAQYQKLLEAYECINYRTGLMLVGNPYTGKSFILQTLAKVVATERGIDENDIDIAFIDPGAVELNCLFDGIVSSVLRQSKLKNLSQWMVFDGPVYCDWAENLNSMLDDNRKLCLNSGETLELTDNTSLIFEVADLKNASPSTISRVGVIYFEPNTLDWQCMTKSWIETCKSSWITECKSFLWDLFEWILPPVIDYINNHGMNLINPLEYNLLRSTFDIIQMIIDDVIKSNADEHQKYLLSWIQAATMYAIAWGIGGILNDESRKLFDQFHRKIWGCSEDYLPSATIKSRLDISFPNEGCLNDYCYIFKQKGTWKLWIDIVRRQDPEIIAQGVYVATADTARYSYMIDMHIKNGKNLLLVGPQSTGKTYLMQNVLRNRTDTNKMFPSPIVFNLRTTAKEVHSEILSRLIKLKRGIYGPPKGKYCVMFIDNVNIQSSKPNESNWSTELIRQIFDYSFIYDLNGQSKINLENISMLTTCGAPGGRYQNLDLRFMNHFNCFSINKLSDESQTRIFTSVLMHRFRQSGHAADVIGSVTQIVMATMQIYAGIKDRFKPTPTRPHYCFNIRDILRLCIGCSLLKKESVENKKMYLKIWFHESLRVFTDRLLELDEKKWVYDQLTEKINDTSGLFKDSMEIVFETYVNDTGIVTIDSIKNLIFGSYLDSETEMPNKKYEEISSLSKLANVATAMINECPDENERTDLDIVLFSHALEHLNRICRIISMPCGSGFLIGSMDSGRKTLIRLAAVLCKQTLFQLRIEPNYSLRSWKEDIKRVLKTAGVMNEQTILYLSENQLTNDVFLTDIDYLLNYGDIPNLWPIEEKQELLKTVRLVAQGGNRNIDISADEVFTFFVNRCHQNLHIIISFSSSGSQLRRLIEMYPSIVHCCTIDIFENWPDNALDMVALKFLKSFEFPKELLDSIVTACKYFHKTASEMAEVYRMETNNNMFVTSSSYLAFINRFTHLYNEKLNEILNAKSRYVQGLDTLLNAAKAVENIQHELGELEPKLRAMAENCRTMTLEIELKTIEANVATEQVRRDELVANDQTASAQQMEDECSKDLAQAVPLLEDALESLNTLKPADITLVKSMSRPPSAVKLVMAAVCVMKGVPPDRINDAASGKKIVDYWGPSKRILGDMGFLQSLKDYNKDDINPDILRKIRKDFIPHKDFQPNIVAKASSAAEGLCKWIKAIENFEAVNAIVQPKQLKLMKAKQILRETRKYLAEKRALVAELDAKVDGLHETLEKINHEKEQTELEASMCQRKLGRAETLIQSLGQEKNRWTEKTVQLQRLLDNLPGDILISSGLIAYLGALSKSYRDQCTLKWHKYCIQQHIPCSKVFSLISCLGHDNEIQQWRLDGLAADESSTENVILARKSRRQCLFIDPEMQANKWIKRTESKNHLKVVKQSDPMYFNVLQNCMENGSPILIEDIIEPLDICLNHILQYRVTSQNQSFKLHSDQSIQISPDFRLYLTSNARNSNFLLNKTGKINIVNFIFALPGLEETLLDTLVLKENPFLREERDQLLQNKLEDKAMQTQCEDAILTAISECDGDILEDETAIRRMDDSKHIYVEVINKQSLYSEAEREIENYRESYRKVSAYAAVLYECLDYLRTLNPMYQFSLDWYFNMYDYSIENANCSKELNRRIDFLIKSITKNLYQSICRSIFDADKLLFSWIIVTNMLMDENRLKEEQLNFFIAGDSVKMGPLSKKPDCDWITDKMWCALCNLAEYIDSDEFISSFEKYTLDWKSYYDNYMESIPNRLNITAFEEIMISKIFHPENIKKAITDFISKEVGEQFVNPPHFDIHKSFDESNISTPLIFILSPGIDPTNILWDFADKLCYSQSMQVLSFGADQGCLIEKAIVNAQKQGHWICIQNCHLNTQFLREVERIWEDMDISNTSPTFRLWMTSEPTPSFPLNLLQNGIKITYERSKGLKSHLLNLYQNSPLSTEFYDSCPEQDKNFKKILYSLTLFDVIVNERKHYGSIGWNIAYQFTHNDFEQSIQLLQQLLSDKKEVPFETLRYIIGELAYGGRIIDNFDKRLLNTILMDLFNKNILTDFVVKMAPNCEYKLPRRLERRMVLKFIEENVPNETNCELYGLHVNSDFIYKLNTSAELLNSIRLTSRQVHMNMESEFENIKSELELIIKKLPQRVEIERDEKELFSYGNSMSTVLVSEMKKYNHLLNDICSTCEHLQQALEGVVSFTQTLEEIVKNIWKNIVPKQWMRVSYPNRKSLGSYLKDFSDRYNWLRSWWISNRFPVSYWFPTFFHPRCFLAAIKLNFARKYKLPMDQLTFDFTILNDAPVDEAEDGAYIHGLFLKAAHWNGHFIEEQLPEKPMEVFPIIHIKPILQNELNHRDLFECPVYQTSGQRKIQENIEIYEEFSIMTILLPIEHGIHRDFWVKRGVSLVCQPEDSIFGSI